MSLWFQPRILGRALFSPGSMAHHGMSRPSQPFHPLPSMSATKRWSVADAAELYNIAGWGRGYFGVNHRGHLSVHPRGNGGIGGGGPGATGTSAAPAIDLKELIEDALSRGISLPLQIRFSDILEHRLAHVHRSFSDAIAAHGYQGDYLGVYPLKVNQQRQVVEDVVRFGATHGIGLEAGSKPELHAALASLDTPGAVIVCNGFKDPAYIRLALLAQKLERRVFLVVEKPAELHLILRISRETGITPLLGMRIRLIATGSGRWEDSGGDTSKFGMASWELLEAVEHLRRVGALESFQLIHAHLGSQINNLRHVTEGVREIGRYYAELRRMGCPIGAVDVGGGLGVDYDGTRSTFGFSVNYSEAEYATEVVRTLAEICRESGLPHPTLISEAGRALTAHHAMLAINVLETVSLGGALPGGALPGGETETAEPGSADTGPAEKMARLLAGIKGRSLSADWAEAQLLREEANTRFELGYLPLEQKARADRMFWAVARRVQRLARRQHQAPEELEELEPLLADKYYCNFSVFQSLPDAWAIHQEFPLAPLHRLDERPTRMGTIQDLTCDSDGRLLTYIGRFEKRESLPLHPLRPGEPYYLGIFLTGAYQEILGDLHNLFGDTNTIHVKLVENPTTDGEGGWGWRYEQIIEGESVAQVLDYVQFDRASLLERVERLLQNALENGSMTGEEAGEFRALYTQGLDGATYLEPASSAEVDAGTEREEESAAPSPQPESGEAG